MPKMLRRGYVCLCTISLSSLFYFYRTFLDASVDLSRMFFLLLEDDLRTAEFEILAAEW